MTYDLYIFAVASYVAFILLLARCTGFNELGDDEAATLIDEDGSPCADRHSGQPTHQSSRRAALAAICHPQSPD